MKASQTATSDALGASTPAGGSPTAGKLGQVVLVLQGGGALGAYQGGVYEALHEAGIEPDWIIGTSIGAINAAIIAGNRVENRLARLKEFWTRVEHSSSLEAMASLPWVGSMMPNWATAAAGIASFFRPNPMAFMGAHMPMAADAVGYYSTQPLAETLGELVDFSLPGISPRLTVGAANVCTSEMRYFDSRDTQLTARHIMASAALPPAFPPIRIDGELYWDGGVLSNTPVEAVFDDFPRRNSLVFAVHIWNPAGPEPRTINQAMNRQKDIQYSSRATSHISRQRQLHKLRHVISELAARLPESERGSEAVRALSSFGCLTRMHVVRLLAPTLESEDHTKDIDFSRKGIRQRWEAGLEDTRAAIKSEPWNSEVDPLEGFVLHEMSRDVGLTRLQGGSD